MEIVNKISICRGDQTFSLKEITEKAIIAGVKNFSFLDFIIRKDFCPNLNYVVQNDSHFGDSYGGILETPYSSGDKSKKILLIRLNEKTISDLKLYDVRNLCDLRKLYYFL